MCRVRFATMGGGGGKGRDELLQGNWVEFRWFKKRGIIPIVPPSIADSREPGRPKEPGGPPTGLSELLPDS